jgi:hypothetical protein
MWIRGSKIGIEKQEIEIGMQGREIWILGRQIDMQGRDITMWEGTYGETEMRARIQGRKVGCRKGKQRYMKVKFLCWEWKKRRCEGDYVFGEGKLGSREEK